MSLPPSTSTSKEDLYRLHHDVGPKSIIDEVVEETPNNFAEENAAMTSFKRPASLKPMIPICVYIILSAAAPAMVLPIIPAQRTAYFGSDTTAMIWGSAFDSANALIGMFTGGLVGLASDAYGRKLVVLVSAFEGCIAMAVFLIFGADNPWPYIVVGNIACVIGSTKIGNAALGFMVVADLFEKECRLLPTLIYVVSLFTGFVCAPIPSALGLSSTTTGILSTSITLFVLIYVWLFFEETLPEDKRKKVSIKDLENPLVPLKFVFRSRYLSSFAILGATFMFPFYVSTGINMYYLKDKLGTFTNTDNGLLMATMSVAGILLLIFVLPVLTRRVHPEHIVLAGMLSMTLNAVLFCLVAEPWQVFSFLSTTEAFTFIAITMMSQMVSVTVPQNEQGVVNGTIAALKEIATVTGPILGSLLYSLGKYHIDREHPFIELPYVLSACVCLFGVGVIVCVLKPEINRRREIANARSEATSRQASDLSGGSPLLASEDVRCEHRPSEYGGMASTTSIQ
jgi:MFS transporter, DHA1 family, tetracycline resistance protein